MRRLRWLAVALLAHGAAFAAEAREPLRSYNVDLAETTVSGVSSGAYMAIQMAFAHSATIRGAGLLAGGPYDCAGDSVVTALGACMQGPPRLDAIEERTRAAAEAELIDPPEALERRRFWLFHGYNDGTVRGSVSDALFTFLGHFVPADQVFYQNRLRAGHAQVTETEGQACGLTGPDFINDCDYSAAGHLLQHLYGRLEPPGVGAPDGELLPFDQRPFVADEIDGTGLADEGFVFVPRSCGQGNRCRLHIAFHGCEQHAKALGERYVRGAGYNRWAATNAIVVLYPQIDPDHAPATALVLPGNPKGCWDWWGYVDDKYATQAGVQIAAVMAMARRLTEGLDPARPWPAPGAATPAAPVVDVSAASVGLAWRPVKDAAGYNLYRQAGDGPEIRVNVLPIRGLSFADQGRTPDTLYRYRLRAVWTGGGESEPSPPAEARTATPAPECDPYYATVGEHVVALRAYLWFGSYLAWGSGDHLAGPFGWWDKVLITRRADGQYHAGPCE